jgi:hypothetical protein
MIYVNEKEFDAQPPEQLAATFQEYNKLREDLMAEKVHVGGNRLQSVTTATTVRVRDGKTQMTDGPFAETREQLGGFFLVEARDLDAATAIAARIPGARIGSIEVRPIRSM